LTGLVQAAIGTEEAPTGVDEYVVKLDKFTSIYEETSHVIDGHTGEEQSFDEAHAHEEATSPSDVAAFEAEVQRLLEQAAGGVPPAAAPVAPEAFEEQ